MVKPQPILVRNWRTGAEYELASKDAYDNSKYADDPEWYIASGEHRYKQGDELDEPLGEPTTAPAQSDAPDNTSTFEDDFHFGANPLDNVHSFDDADVTVEDFDTYDADEAD